MMYAAVSRKPGRVRGCRKAVDPRPREAAMSDRVTWEVCPICGDLAAVGWTTIRWATGEPFQDFATEFDCPSGCASATSR